MFDRTANGGPADQRDEATANGGKAHQTKGVDAGYAFVDSIGHELRQIQAKLAELTSLPQRLAAAEASVQSLASENQRLKQRIAALEAGSVQQFPPPAPQRTPPIVHEVARENQAVVSGEPWDFHSSESPPVMKAAPPRFAAQPEETHPSPTRQPPQHDPYPDPWAESYGGHLPGREHVQPSMQNSQQQPSVPQTKAKIPPPKIEHQEYPPPLVKQPPMYKRMPSTPPQTVPSKAPPPHFGTGHAPNLGKQPPPPMSSAQISQQPQASPAMFSIDSPREEAPPLTKAMPKPKQPPPTMPDASQHTPEVKAPPVRAPVPTVDVSAPPLTKAPPSFAEPAVTAKAPPGNLPETGASLAKAAPAHLQVKPLPYPVSVGPAAAMEAKAPPPNVEGVPSRAETQPVDATPSAPPTQLAQPPVVQTSQQDIFCGNVSKAPPSTLSPVAKAAPPGVPGVPPMPAKPPPHCVDESGPALASKAPPPSVANGSPQVKAPPPDPAVPTAKLPPPDQSDLQARAQSPAAMAPALAKGPPLDRPDLQAKAPPPGINGAPQALAQTLASPSTPPELSPVAETHSFPVYPPPVEVNAVSAPSLDHEEDEPVPEPVPPQLDSSSFPAKAAPLGQPFHADGCPPWVEGLEVACPMTAPQPDEDSMPAQSLQMGCD